MQKIKRERRHRFLRGNPKWEKPRAEETTEKFTITIRSTTLANGDYNEDLIKAYILKDDIYLYVYIYIYYIEKRDGLIMKFFIICCCL